MVAGSTKLHACAATHTRMWSWSACSPGVGARLDQLSGHAPKDVVAVACPDMGTRTAGISKGPPCPFIFRPAGSASGLLGSSTSFLPLARLLSSIEP